MSRATAGRKHLHNSHNSQTISEGDPVTTDAAELGGPPKAEASAPEDPTTADAAELGVGTVPAGGLHLEPAEASRLHDEAVRAVSRTQQALLEAAGDSLVLEDPPRKQQTLLEAARDSLVLEDFPLYAASSFGSRREIPRSFKIRQTKTERRLCRV